jgi:hypothetical protein
MGNDDISNESRSVGGSKKMSERRKKSNLRVVVLGCFERAGWSLKRARSRPN